MILNKIISLKNQQNILVIEDEGEEKGNKENYAHVALRKNFLQKKIKLIPFTMSGKVN